MLYKYHESRVDLFFWTGAQDHDGVIEKGETVVSTVFLHACGCLFDTRAVGTRIYHATCRIIHETAPQSFREECKGFVKETTTKSGEGWFDNLIINTTFKVEIRR